jgi:hypothetical protein
MSILLFDNNFRHQLYPFTHTRAVGAIRSGIFTPQERWELITGDIVQIQTSKSIQPLYGKPEISANTLWIDAALIVNTTLIDQINALQTGQCLFDATGFIAGVGETNLIEHYTTKTKLAGF